MFVPSGRGAASLEFAFHPFDQFRAVLLVRPPLGVSAGIPSTKMHTVRTVTKVATMLVISRGSKKPDAGDEAKELVI